MQLAAGERSLATCERNGVHLQAALGSCETEKAAAKQEALGAIREMAANPMIRGFTTNPTLMRKAGVSDYETFAKEVLDVVPDLPVSFEVFADDWEPMERQALKIASWGPNVNVKIPVTNTRGESSAELVNRLSNSGVSPSRTS